MSRRPARDQLSLFEPIGRHLGAVEQWAEREGYDTVIGVDEAGRGPLAGPVVAGAVVLDVQRAEEEGWLDQVTDSKQLTADQRDALFDRIRLGARACAVAQAEAREIDEVNILQATLRAMAAAVRQVRETVDLDRTLVAVDGNTLIPGISPQEAVVKGDSRSYNIAAASILAKVTRDRILERYDGVWPEYGFGGHKGYPTVSHRRCVLSLGPTPVHRRSFRVTPPKT